MKQKDKIRIALLIYIISMIVMVSGVMFYIDLKQHRLSNEISTKFDNLFDGGKKIVDIAYSNIRVEYSDMAIPNMQKTIKKALDAHKFYPDSYKDELTKIIRDSYSDELDDLKRMYQLKYEPTMESPYRANGWSLFVIEKKGRDYAWCSYMFPYAVGYKKQYYDYTPSVSDAVSEAFKFYTTNNESGIASCVRNDFYENFADIKGEIKNEYYYLKTDIGEPILSHMFKPLFFDYPDQETSYCYRNGYMYNGYFKVFVGMTPPAILSIEYIPGSKENNTIKLIVLYGLAITLLLLIYILPFLRKMVKYKKIKKESLYKKLLRVSNPSNFIDNYNKEKVDLANSIYSRLVDINQDDNESLMALLDEVEVGLGISIVDDEMVSELKKKVNPKKYIKPYDAEKVSLANDLYSRLTNDNISYKEIIQIEEESKKL